MRQNVEAIVEYFKSGIKDAQANVKALGLKKIGQSVIHDATPQIKGQIFAVKHMVKVEEINE